MESIIFKNIRIVNEGKSEYGDVWIKDDRIERIDPIIDRHGQEINGSGKWLLPGVIDDQVHFREPGMPEKGNIASESKAAVAGGVTSFMDMPNNKPPCLSQKALHEKFEIAKSTAYANYSFYLGASNNNMDELVKTDARNVCGIKVFMGSSTGNMLVDDEKTLEAIFRNAPILVATHCEDEARIRANKAIAREQYGTHFDVNQHPLIRDAEVCFLSSSKAVKLARKHNTRLHIIHLSSEKEMALFRDDIALEHKRITTEVCVHHLWFSEKDYARMGSKIQCNPAIKSEQDRQALWAGLLSGKLDIIATDHAPHTLQEKEKAYPDSPSGLPLVQHSLQMMLEKASGGLLTPEEVVNKMCHNPAICFNIENRGFIREGYAADLVLIDPDKSEEVNSKNIYYHCGWSPMEGIRFRHQIMLTLVNGKIAYRMIEGKADFYQGMGKALSFNR